MTYTPSERGAKLWTHFVKRYGPKFLHDNGQVCREDWDTLVRRSPDADIRQALEHCKTKHPQYAPTVVQFEALIRGAAQSHVPTQAHVPTDKFTVYTDRFLWAYLMSKRPVASAASLLRITSEARRLRDAYREICTDEPEASVELKAALLKACDAVYEPASAEELQAIVDNHQRAIGSALPKQVMPRVEQHAAEWRKAREFDQAVSSAPPSRPRARTAYEDVGGADWGNAFPDR